MLFATPKPATIGRKLHQTWAIAQGSGIISFRAKQNSAGSMVKIEVEDNGQGFDPYQPSSHGSTHIGLSNVQKRLSNCFGNELSWQIDTQPNQGTKITIIIPAVKAV